jgi:hypothetical protein
MRLTRDSAAALLASAAVIAVIIAGFYRTHGPSMQRLLRSDQKRVDLVGQLANEIRIQYNNAHQKLPAELTALQSVKYKDPVTGHPLEYSVKSETQYTICTTLDLPTPKDDEQKVEYAFWKHSAGHACFDFDTNAPSPPVPYTYYSNF